MSKMDKSLEIYYREVNVPFKILKFTKNNIKTRVEATLNFYEKYIILILKDGVKAKDKAKLADEISNMLNIKYGIVFKFIKLLEELDAIKLEGGIYSLTDNTIFTSSDNYKDIMLANLKESEDSIDYIYILETGNLISRNLLEKSNIEIYNLSISTSNILSIKQDIITKSKIGKQIATDSLQKTVFSNFEFSMNDFEDVEKGNINLPIKIEYLYDREKGYGIYSNCNVNIENEYIAKYILPENISLKIKTEYGIDSKKPDYIILEEQLEKEKIQIEKLKSEQNVLKELEVSEKQKSNDMKQLTDSIEFKNKTIKELKKEIASLKQETKEYKIKKKEYDKQEQENILLKEKVEELKKEKAIIEKTKKEKKDEIRKIENKVAEDHQKIILDDFERKLEIYKTQIDKIDSESYAKLYEESTSLYSTLLSLSKKINNDSKDLHREWTNLYTSYSVFIKVVLCYMLKLTPKLFNSIKAVIDNSSATDLGLKFNISIEDCRNIKLMETISDTGRHKVDSVQKVKQDSASHKESTEAFKNYILSPKDDRKQKLIAIFQIFLKGKFNENDYKNINDMCIAEAERTGIV